VNWHFIGRLQSNKARQVVRLCDWIHSVDSLALAQQLSTLATQEGRHPRILFQVKLAEDPTKTGWAPDELEQQLPNLITLPNLDPQGFMTIAPFGLGADATSQLFQAVAAWVGKVRQMGYAQLTELSMGMSGDYPLALEAGTTMVRLGQALFGSRPPRVGV